MNWDFPTGNNSVSSRDFQQRAAESQGAAQIAGNFNITGYWLNHTLESTDMPRVLCSLCKRGNAGSLKPPKEDQLRDTVPTQEIGMGCHLHKWAYLGASDRSISKYQRKLASILSRRDRSGRVRALNPTPVPT